MSRKSDSVRLYRILELLTDADKIVARHGTVPSTLEDTEGEYAILMILSQIGEVLGKIEDDAFVRALPVREATGLRNLIVHDYEGVNRRQIHLIFEHSLPELKRAVQGLLESP